MSHILISFKTSYQALYCSADFVIKRRVQILKGVKNNHNYILCIEFTSSSSY